MKNVRTLHPLTGLSLLPVGLRKDGRPILPILGGDPTNDDPQADPPADPPKNDDPQAEPPPPGAGADGKTDEQRGYPLNTPVDDMKIEQQNAYYKAIARKHEQSFKKLAGNHMTPEKIAAMVKAQEAAEEAAKSELDRAVDAARKEGRESALADAASGTVDSLIAAHVVAAKLDKTKDADVLETLETLNRKSFIGSDGQVDAAKLIKVLNRLAPTEGGGGSGNGGWPDTGQGRRGNGTGSAKDAGIAESVRRGYRKAE